MTKSVLTSMDTMGPPKEPSGKSDVTSHSIGYMARGCLENGEYAKVSVESCQDVQEGQAGHRAPFVSNMLEQPQIMYPTRFCHNASNMGQNRDG